MASPIPPDWAKLTAALYPHLTDAERENLRRIWAGNYEKFAPLKAQLDTGLDPDFRVEASTGPGKVA
jgi:hypothetical protein